MSSTKAIVIGGGIGGLSVAIALEKAGISVDIYERAPALKPVGAGISLWANAIKALDQLDVGERIRALGTRDLGGGIYTPNGKTLIATNIEVMRAKFGTPTIVVHRADLIDILQDRVAGQVHLNKQFSGYQEDGKNIIAHFSDGTSTTANMLVCADGIHSVLRQSWFPQSNPVYSGYTAWRGVTQFDHAHVGAYWGETVGRGIRFGITPLPNNHIYWFATKNIPAGVLKDEIDHQAYLLQTFDGWHTVIPNLIQATPKEAILNNDIYDIQPITEWVRGNVALLGDSAHAMTPNLGQGGCMAIEDAVVLGKCLRANADIAEALQAYQQLRVPRANKVQKMSRMLGKVMTTDSAVLSTLRNMVLRITPPAIQMRNIASIVRYEV